MGGQWGGLQRFSTLEWFECCFGSVSIDSSMVGHRGVSVRKVEVGGHQACAVPGLRKPVLSRAG